MNVFCLDFVDYDEKWRLALFTRLCFGFEIPIASMGTQFNYQHTKNKF